MSLNSGCQVINRNDIKSYIDKIKNNLVIVELVDGTLYNMSIKDITDMGVKGSLLLGVVPEYLTPGHTWPILADSLILFDYINKLII